MDEEARGGRTSALDPRSRCKKAPHKKPRVAVGRRRKRPHLWNSERCNTWRRRSTRRDEHGGRQSRCPRGRRASAWARQSRLKRRAPLAASSCAAQNDGEAWHKGAPRTRRQPSVSPGRQPASQRRRQHGVNSQPAGATETRPCASPPPELQAAARLDLGTPEAQKGRSPPVHNLIPIIG